MTPAQEDAMDEAKAILSLHFDAFTISTRSADEEGRDQFRSDWRGALSDVIGIHRITALRLDKLAGYSGGKPEVGP